MSWSPDHPFSVTPIRVADLLVEDGRMPVFVHLVEHPSGRILVDTGMMDTHPAVADMDPRLAPLAEQDVDLDGIDAVVNTHLHFDHCGGNRLFPGRPIHVQRAELDDARTLDDYTIPEWVDAPGLDYRPVDGDLGLVPGIRLLATPGHTRGSQVVVVDGADGPIVIAGDTAVFPGELDDPRTEGQRRVRDLEPARVWLAHAEDPWTPPTLPR